MPLFTRRLVEAAEPVRHPDAARSRGGFRSPVNGAEEPGTGKLLSPAGRAGSLGVVATRGRRRGTPRRGPGGPTVQPVRLRPALALAALSLLTGPAPAEPPGFKALAIGDPAPNFQLPGVDGRTYALKDFADARVLVVVFTC